MVESLCILYLVSFLMAIHDLAHLFWWANSGVSGGPGMGENGISTTVY